MTNISQKIDAINKLLNEMNSFDRIDTNTTPFELLRLLHTSLVQQQTVTQLSLVLGKGTATTECFWNQPIMNNISKQD